MSRVRRLILAGSALGLVTLAALVATRLPLGDGIGVVADPGIEDLAARAETQWGTRIEVSGSQVELITDVNGLRIQKDLAGVSHLRQVGSSGVNIILDQGECPLGPDVVSLERQLGRTLVLCRGLSLIGGGRVDLEGWIVRDANEVLPQPAEGAGGSLFISGDRQGTIDIIDAAWYVAAPEGRQTALLAIDRPQREPQDLNFFTPQFGFTLSDEGMPTLEFIRPDFGFPPSFFSVTAGDCVETFDEQGPTGDDREAVLMTIQCDRLPDIEGNERIKVVGSILIERITVDTID